jgi:hypothetical protein
LIFAPQCRLAFQPAVLETPTFKNHENINKKVDLEKYCKQKTVPENVETSRHKHAHCLHHEECNKYY